MSLSGGKKENIWVLYVRVQELKNILFPNGNTHMNSYLT